MNNFEGLFKEAAITADKRKKVFNQLIEKTKNEILPKFCEACFNLDIKTVYFKTDNKPTKNLDQEPHDIDWGEVVYALAIDVENKTMVDATYNPHSGNIWVPDHWVSKDIKDVEFTRTGIIEFVTDLNSRLNSYIKKYDEKTKKLKI